MRNTSDWKERLPSENWVLFCFANEEDEDLLAEVVGDCLEKRVSCIYCAGEIAYKAELDFDIGIVNHWGSSIDSRSYHPLTTASKNFDEEFWDAASLTYDPCGKIKKVICLNLNKKGIKQYLISLIDKVNDPEWIPSEETILYPSYDQAE
ncbi:MAG: hypothetical protein AAF696_25160 [Bacteroidota bacterium]